MTCLIVCLQLGSVSKGRYEKGRQSKAKGIPELLMIKSPQLPIQRLTDLAVEPSQPQTPLPQSSIDSTKDVNEPQMQPFTCSPKRKAARPSLLSSSPPPLAGNDQGGAERFKSMAGKTPGRRELAEMMGVAYEDKAGKTRIRAAVKGYLLTYMDMSKPFSQYSYPEVMYPIVRGCTAYMNREGLDKDLPRWTRTVTQHMIHSVLEDTRRNQGSKERSASKRKEQRELAVSWESPSSSTNAACLLTPNLTQVGSATISQSHISSQHEGSQEMPNSQLTEESSSKGPGIPPASHVLDLDQRPTPAGHHAPSSQKQKDFITAAVTPHRSGSARKQSDHKPRSKLQASSKEPILPPGIVKVIPMSGSRHYPAFYIVPGSPWNVLFVNLAIWLPELKQVELAAQDSVMIQYKTDFGWVPLAGDEQLNYLLSEFLLSKSDLFLRCAPESEFRSGPDSELDENGNKNGDNGDGSPISAIREDKKIVSLTQHTTRLIVLSYDLPC